ncbi:MAG: MarR family winged helix-turn-helix transcriptional regulator [Candidatus Hermodarchaeota archaeon]
MFKSKETLLGLVSNISNLILRLARQFEQEDRNHLRFHGIEGVTPPQLFILRCLWAEDGIQINHLANMAKVSLPTMSGIIDTMEKNNFVTRVPNPDDKRSKLIKLTKKGENVRKYRPPIDSSKIDYFKNFKPAELENINRLLEKLSKSLEL